MSESKKTRQGRCHTPAAAMARPAAARMSHSDHIKVCQVGYLPEETKLAILTAEPATPTAAVCRADTGEVVVKVPIGEKAAEPHSEDRVRPVDFSAVAEPGVYYLDIPGVGTSFCFQIGPEIFSRPFRLSMRMFYGQRCGTEVSLAPDFPEFHYPACHPNAEYHPSSGKSGTAHSPAGWHDAGDYGRYIVNSGISTGTLLWAFELYREKLEPICLDLPESGGPLPDMLAEIRWNLDWMLSMQDSDGGVWHKATTARFCGMIMPQDDAAPTQIVGTGEAPFKSTAATANFAAVCAAAARVYRPFDPSYAKKCLGAASRAWEWLAATADSLFLRNPEGIGTGPYSDHDVRDERLWAASELFRTTGKREYGEYFLAHYREWHPTVMGSSAQSWSNVRNLAMYCYALSGEVRDDQQAVEAIKTDSLRAADAIAARIAEHGYRVPLLVTDYVWGSNAVLANYAMMLSMANLFQPNERYTHGALDCLHYLFGRNTFNTSFVTQIGTQWAMRPHHRPSAADGVREPWPGMLVGGPFSRHGTPPARQWFDETPSYSTNEIAINWNAPLVFVLAGMLR